MRSADEPLDLARSGVPDARWSVEEVEGEVDSVSGEEAFVGEVLIGGYI